jgi:hypothetical protein
MAPVARARVTSWLPRHQPSCLAFARKFDIFEVTSSLVFSVPKEVNDRGARLALCERGRRRVVSPHGVGAALG